MRALLGAMTKLGLDRLVRVTVRDGLARHRMSAERGEVNDCAVDEILRRDNRPRNARKLWYGFRARCRAAGRRSHANANGDGDQRSAHLRLWR